MQHIHNDNILGLYPDVKNGFQVNFVHTLFHTSGFIGQYFVGNQKTSDAQGTLFWDSTGSSIQPIETGDPNGVKTWSGHFNINPMHFDPLGKSIPLPHGWAKTNSNIYAYLPDGSTVKTIVYLPYHSIIDLTAPEVTSNQDHLISAECQVSSPGSGNQYGQQVVSIESILPAPLADGSIPINAPYSLQYGTYNYANNFTFQEPATSDIILDADFHMHPLDDAGGGTILFTATATGDFPNKTFILDPAKLGPAGKHKIIIRRKQPNKGDNLMTLLVFFITTNSGGPIPCTPPKILVNNQCVDPTPVAPVLIGPTNLFQFPDGSFKNCGPNATHCSVTQ